MRDTIIGVLMAFTALLVSATLSLQGQIDRLTNKVYYGRVENAPVPDERAPDLEELYAEINLKHFGGRLPKDVKIYWSAQIEALGFDGVTAVSEHVIRIGRSMKNRPNAAKMVLCHEMCHFLHEGHGMAFENEMKRLAKEDTFFGAW